MNKNDLVRKMSEISGKTIKESELHLNSFLEAVKYGLTTDGQVQLIGFGTFQVKERAERTARNLKTGEEIFVPKSKTVTYKVGKTLKEEVNL